MFAVIVSEKGGSTERHEFTQNEVTIGRVQGNDIILAKGNVSKRHTRIVLKDGRFIVVDLKSTNGTYVNGRKVTSPLVVKPGDKIYIGDFTVTIEGTGGTHSGVPARIGSDPQAPKLDTAPPSPSVPEPPASQAPPQSALPLRSPGSQPQLPPAPPTAEAARPSPKTWEPPKRAPAASPALDVPEPPSNRGTSPRGPLAEVGSRGGTTKHTSAYEALANVVGDRNLHAVMTRLEVEFDVHDTSAESMRDDARWTEAERLAERAVQRLVGDGMFDEADAGPLAAAAVREAVGLGAVEVLMADERVREILVSAPSQVFADHGEGLESTGTSFSDGRALLTFVRRLASRAGAFLEPRATSHDFLLPSGAHVAVLMPPLTVGSPVVEIRRVHRGPTLDELAASHAISGEARAALVRAIAARKTIAVVGPAGSGVTSTLAALASAVPEEERVVVASQEPNLRLEQPQAVMLTAGLGQAKLRFRDVIEHAARLRSDRLVLDGLASDELRLALARLGGRPSGDLLGIRARTGEAPLAALRRLLELGGASASEAETLLEQGLSIIVELDGEHGVRRIKRVTELRRGERGLELVELGA